VNETHKRPRRARFEPSLVSLLLLGGCSSDGAEHRPPAQTNRDLGDVLYEPGTNDEGLLVLLDAAPVNDAAREPMLTSPLDGAVLAQHVLVSFDAGAASLFRRRPSPRKAPNFMLDLLTLERTAHAHGAPMNGDAYLIAFSADDGRALLRVFTHDTSFAVSGTPWQKLTATTRPVTLQVTRGTFEEGRLTADGGPYVSQPVYFTVTQ
jgi:hypothetical protein